MIARLTQLPKVCSASQKLLMPARLIGSALYVVGIGKPQKVSLRLCCVEWWAMTSYKSDHEHAKGQLPKWNQDPWHCTGSLTHYHISCNKLILDGNMEMSTHSRDTHSYMLADAHLKRQPFPATAKPTSPLGECMFYPLTLIFQTRHQH
jgi:hypothetical protein